MKPKRIHVEDTAVMAVVFDKQANNRIPGKTLVLNAASSVTVSLLVF